MRTLLRTELSNINPELLNDFELFLEEYFSEIKFPFSQNLIEEFYNLPQNMIKSAFTDYFKMLNGEELTSDNLIEILVKFKKVQI